METGTCACPFRSSGCHFSVESADALKQHTEQALSAHMQLLHFTLQKTNNEMRLITQENKSLRQRLSHIENRSSYHIPDETQKIIDGHSVCTRQLRKLVMDLQTMLAKQQNQIMGVEENWRELSYRIRQIEEARKTDKKCLVISGDAWPVGHTDSVRDQSVGLAQRVETILREKMVCRHGESFAERIKSVEFGRQGNYIWRITGFRTVFNNAKDAHNDKDRVSPYSPTDFCSPLFYTSQHGYCMYLRCFPYGADAAIGKSLSLFVSLSPGDYDGILPWPFHKMIEIGLISQNGSSPLVKTIIPGDARWAQRPGGKGRNMSVGVQSFIGHSELFQGAEEYLKNDQINIEITIKDVPTPATF